MADMKPSLSMLADTPCVLITREPPVHSTLSSNEGRDVINCNNSSARRTGSRSLMALPSTVTSNRYAVAH
eukprot:5888037-Lingulodinium_polyedra.AAC.1